jgi:N-glycosylase/DNA lyase
MDKIIKEIKKLQNSDVSKVIAQRLKEFKQLGNKGDDDWFCELCFCILTANSKASTALSIQEELGVKGFLCNSKDSVCDCIKKNKHRFHNNKSKYIVEARKYKDIKYILLNKQDPRGWVAENIKGLGYKEASHFLRNVGYQNYAIIDRHVINILAENKLIKKPGSISKKLYLEIEEILGKIALKLKMSQAELDLYLWYMKTGKVLK